MKRPLIDRRPPAPQRGFATIAIIAVLAILMMLAGVWTRTAARQARQMRRQEERAQAQWLAEAGVRRAAARLARDAAYTGEDWLIDAEELGRQHDAEVAIEVAPAEAAPGELRLIAKARYPRDAARVRITKSVLFTPPQGESEP